MLQPDQSLVGSAGPMKANARGEQPPFIYVQGLEALGTRRFALALAVALSLHLMMAFRGIVTLKEVGDFARTVRDSVQAQVRQSIDVMVEPEPEPPPEPEPEPEPPAEPEPPPPVPQPPAEKPPPTAQPEPPAPAAAQAGRVLTAEPDPDEPLDLTGDAFVQGNADFYAGGVTASKGTATQAVRNVQARADGVVGGVGTAPASAVDRSRPAAPQQRNWNCPFPPESDIEQINYQNVTVSVTVSAAGKPLDVKVLSNGGFGFGPAAQRCALSKVFLPALDREGNPITTTIPIIVNFERR